MLRSRIEYFGSANWCVRVTKSKFGGHHFLNIYCTYLRNFYQITNLSTSIILHRYYAITLVKRNFMCTPLRIHPIWWYCESSVICYKNICISNLFLLWNCTPGVPRTDRNGFPSSAIPKLFIAKSASLDLVFLTLAIRFYRHESYLRKINYQLLQRKWKQMWQYLTQIYS